MFEQRHQRRSAFLCAAFAVLLGGCATQMKAPTAQQVRELKRIDVAIQGPPSNFAYGQGSQAFYVPVGPNISAGAAVGISLGASLLTAAIDHVRTSTARAAQEPVGKSVEDLDLPGTALEQLRVLHANATSAPQFNAAAQEFPKLAAGDDALAALREQAKASPADATLFVRVATNFSDPDGRVILYGASHLISRSGETLLSTNTAFVGPPHPDGTQAEVVRWWADGRYRRFLAQGARAVVWPIAQGLLNPPADEARRAAIESTLSRLPALTSNGQRMHSTACSLESDDVKVVYRFERQRQNIRAAAYCPGETLALLEADLVTDVSWVTSPLPAPPAPVVRKR